MPLANLECLNLHSLNTLWLAALFYTNPLFLNRISFLIYAYLIYTHFLWNTNGAYSKGWAYKSVLSLHMTLCACTQTYIPKQK